MTVAHSKILSASLTSTSYSWTLVSCRVYESVTTKKSACPWTSVGSQSSSSIVYRSSRLNRVLSWMDSYTSSLSLWPQSCISPLFLVSFLVQCDPSSFCLFAFQHFLFSRCPYNVRLVLCIHFLKVDVLFRLTCVRLFRLLVSPGIDRIHKRLGSARLYRINGFRHILPLPAVLRRHTLFSAQCSSVWGFSRNPRISLYKVAPSVSSVFALLESRPY